MLKNLKKVAAIVLSFAMAVQFGLADSYYVNAVEEPVEPQQQEETTTTPQEQEEVPTTEEEAPQQQQQEEEDAQPVADEEPQPAADEEPQPAAEEAPQDDSTNGENQANNEAQPTPVMAAMLADNPAATYSVELKDQNGNSLGSKTITVGNVADQFPGGKETIGDKTYSYIEARVVNTANEKEYTPITYVAVYDGVTYYSTNSVTGSPLDTTSEKLVVVLKEDVTQYSVKYTLTVDGTDKSSEIANYIALEGSESTVDTGTSFSFLVKPNKGFTVKSVKQDGKVLTADGTKYTTRNVVADSTISIELTEKKEAKITFTGSNTKFTYNGKTQNTGNNYSHNLTLSSTYKTSVTELNFKLLGYLEWTSNSKELNKLAISLTYDGTSSLTGKSINIPTKPGETVETTLTDSLTAVVKKSSTKQSIGSGQYSYEYNVTLRSTKNIYDDIKITTNFKDSTSAELFVTSIVGVTSIYVNNKELDPSNSDASFINLNSNETYTFKFNVLPGYVPDASKIKVTGTVDGDDIGTVSIKNNTGSDKAKYPYYFTIKAAYGKTDYRIQVTAIQSEYKFVYKADGISSSNKLKGGEETAITAQRPKKENYVFKGWKIDSDESGKVYTSKEVVKVNDLIQYSKWDANENLSKITFTPVWIEADKAQQVTYRVVVHFDDGTEDKVYEATTAPGKDVKVFRSKLDTALGIDTDEYYVDPNQSFDLQNVKDGDTITINYCKRKEIAVNSLSDVPYNGESQKQEPVVTIKDDNSKVLQKDVDYTLSYSKDTKNVGTVTVTVTGKGLYKGTQQVTYRITPRPVTVTGRTYTKVYGTDDPELEADVENLVKGEKIDYAVTRAPGNDVGDYAVIPSGEKDQGNYEVTYKNGKLTITKAEKFELHAALSAESRTKPYDGNKLEGAATATVTDGTTISYSVDGGEWTTKVPSIKNVKKVTVKAKAENPNYETPDEIEYTLEITKRPVTVTGRTYTKVYGTDDPELEADVENLVKGEKIDYAVTRAPGNDVGDYAVIPSGEKDQGNYEVTYKNGKLTITKAEKFELHAALSAESRTKPYDGNKLEGAATATVTDGTTISYSVDGGEWTTKVPSIKNVKKVTVKAKAENPNYETPDEIEYTLEITKRPVTVTGRTYTKVYGTDDPELEADVENLVKGEKIDYAVTRAPGNDVGDYAVIPSGEKDQGNYEVTYKNGKLTITKAEKFELHAALSAESRTKPYDGNKLEGAATATVTDGTTISYSVDGGEWTTKVPSIKNVKKVTVKAKAENPNYETPDEIEYTLEITKRPVTVTGRTYTKVYGTDDPELEADVENLVKGEKIDYAVTRAPGNDVGDYAVIPSGEKDQGNYEVTYKNGKLTITKAEKFELHAALSAESRTKPYDGNKLEGAATATVTDGTTISYSVDGGEWTTKVPSIKNVKKVTVKAKAENPNYETPDEIEYTLEITKRPVTVTGRTYTKVYGTDDPELEADVENLVKGEKIDYAVTRAPGNDVGDYAVIPSGEKDQGNYEVTYKNGKLTITKAEKFELHAALSAESRTKPYDGNKLEGAATATVTDGTTISYSVDGGEWTTKVPSIKNVKKVTVKAKAENPNYETPDEIEYTLEITKRPVTVTGRTYTKVYGTDDPELEADVENLVKGEKIDYAVTRAPGNDVGDYAVIPSGEKDQGNYEVTYKNGKLTITKAEKFELHAALSAESRTKPYDGNKLEGAATATVTDGTTISYSVDGGEWTTKVPSIKNVKKVTVKAKAENPNYETPDEIEYTLEITKRPVTVTGRTYTKVYGTDDPELEADVENLVKGEKIDYAVTRAPGNDVGDYAVIPSGEKDQGNYEVTYKNGKLTITKAEKFELHAALSAESRTKPYDGNKLEGAATATVTDGTTISYSVDGGEWTTKVPSIKNVKKVTVKAKAENPNYETPDEIEYTLEITKRPVTVTGRTYTKVYGTDDPELEADVENLVKGEKIDYAVTRAPGNDVGDYAVIPSGEKDQGNYEVTYKNGKLTITKAEKFELHAALSAESRTKPYDGNKLEGAATATVTDGTTISYSVDGGEWTTKVPSIKNVKKVTVKAKAENPNYETPDEIEYTLEITKRPVTVTGRTYTKVYGTDDPELEADVENLVKGEKIDYAVTRAPGNDVGDYAVIPSGEKDQGNYEVTYKNGKLTITKAEKFELHAALSAESRTKPYDGNKLEGAATATVTDGTTISYSVDGGEWTTKVPSIKNVKKVTVKAKAENPNYETPDEIEYTLEITKRPVTVTGRTYTKVYGTDDPELEADVENLVKGEKIDYAVTRAPGNDVGDYAVIPSGEKDQGNYEVTYKNGKLTITKAEKFELHAALSAESRTKPYDGNKLEGAATATVTDGTTISYSVDGGEWTTKVPSIKNVKKVTVKAKAENPNYETPDEIEYTLEITKRPVTVTGRTYTKVYGTDDPELEADVENLVKGEKIDYAVTRAPGNDVGDYAVIPSGEKDQGNYEVTYKNGKLTITKAEKFELHAALSAESRTKPYDGNKLEGAATATVTDGTTISYSVDGGEWTTKVPSIKNVKKVTVKAKAENPNYETPDEIEYTLEITKRPVTVTGRTYTKVYGTDDPELEADVENLVKGEKIDYAVTRAPGNDVGDYAVIPSGEKDQGNYEVTYKNGKLTITKAEKFELHAALSAESRTKPYDGNKLEGAATATVTDGTTISYSVDGGEWTTKVPSIKNVKKVTVKAKAENPNYETPDEIEYTLEITKRPVTVTGRTYTKVYGTDDPELEADVENLVKGEKIDYAVTRAPGNDVGDYAVIPSGEKDQGNYEVTYKNGKLTITKAETMTLTPELTGKNAEKVYDSEPLSGGAKASVKEGTKITYSTDGGETWSETLPSITDVGTLNVKAKAENKNYKDVTVDYTLKVTRKPVTVTADNKSKVFGETDPELSATVAGTLGDDTVDYTLSREDGEAVGKYEITVKGDKLQGNYSVTYIAGTLTITSQSIDPGTDPEKPNPDYTGAKVNNPSDEVYDGNEHKWIPTVTDKADKKLEAGTDYTVEYSTKNFKDVGTIEVVIKGKGNYTGTVTRTYKITPKSVTVTAEDKTKVFGESDPKLTATVAGTLGDDTVDYKLSREDGEAVGKYTITASGKAEQGNYSVTYATGTLTITSQSIDPGTDPEKPNPDYTGAKVNRPSDAVYDGKEHMWSPTVTDKSKTLELGKDYTVEYSTSDFTNVGTIEVVITGAGNYSGTVKRSYKVTPKEYTVTTESATKTYSGTALTAGGKVEGIVSGETVEFTTTGSQTEVGTSKNTYELVWKSAKATNYTLAKESIGELTVKAKSIVPDDKDTPESDKTGITVSEPSDSMYDGNEHKEVLTVTDTKTGKELVAGTDYSVTYSSDLVNAGTVTIKVAGLGNYTGSFTKTYKITKRSVTLTSATVSKVYDGSALTNTDITVSGDGFVEGEGASYEVTGTQTEVGNSANAFEYKLNENTLASNYNITKVVGTLTITAAPAPVTPATPSTPSSTTSTTPRTPSAPQVTTPVETVEKETTPKAEPKKEEKVEEEYTPKASPQYYWALINLICAILTVLFGLLLLISKRHKSEDDDEEDDDETKQQTNDDDEDKEQEKKRGLFTRVLAVLIAIVSVVFFLVTEDLSLPWTWTDQWTIWMVVIGLVQIVVFFVGRKWKNVDDDDEEAQQA